MASSKATAENNCDPEEAESWYDAARKDFAAATTLDGALLAAWGAEGDRHPKHGFYQHYTTVSSVVTKLAERRWWLTRGDSDNLNDRQESQKFGERGLFAKTYQASFVHGAAESAALWGLYCPGNPNAIRITISGEAIGRWVDGMSGGVICSSADKGGERKIITADFRDIVYAAVSFRDKKRTRYDVKRKNGLYWSEVNSHGDIAHLEDDVRREDCTGWIKDYEWRHERESRLCVRIARVDGPKAMWVRVTDDLANDMKFTFSPWLPKEQEAEIEKILASALRAGFGEGVHASNPHRFRRSVLQGAMNLKNAH